MAQGKLKVANKKISAGAQKRKNSVKANASKGRKTHKPKGRKMSSAFKQKTETTKAINEKNQAIISAKVLNSGSKLFLSDIKESGSKELKAQAKEQLKKEGKINNMSERLKNQLKKLNGKLNG
mmetsp:Transcript_6153/g.7750  ORF Transcript_6153/g.7750 Transcript_6153/m.7750 type:complete len:123 (-) Transcript_6153:81-449(-)